MSRPFGVTSTLIPTQRPQNPSNECRKAAHALVQPFIEAPAPKSNVESSSVNVVNEISEKNADERAIDSQYVLSEC
jgi:hypothetical protein